ncbi:hypothetical protein [Antrihabitans stalactiti]|uniref:Uncharacterized protein n=1 Tax=Antrihabitans stalactiti TaxID=2584121 RepID=A0A848KG44_9NOCA|nr:hypothetical protein [Antrihabitans stalactiti]NMN95180.1 hypothetical protein [Antrihabitans stalactiti]
MARLDAALNALEHPFGRWLVDEELASSDAEIESIVETAWAGVTAMLDECSDFQLTRIDAHALDHLLDTIPVPEDPDAAADLVDAVLLPVGMFMNFLFDTDRWTGSEDDYTEATSMIMELVNESEAPHVEPEDEVEALLALPMTAQLQDLLRWVGEGRGLDELSGSPITDDRLWRLAIEHGLVEMDAGRFVLAPHADEWPHHTADIEEKVDELRSAAALYIALMFNDADPDSADAQTRILEDLARHGFADATADYEVYDRLKPTLDVAMDILDELLDRSAEGNVDEARAGGVDDDVLLRESRLVQKRPKR